MKLKLFQQILIALGLAVVAGLLTQETNLFSGADQAGIHANFLGIYSFFGTLFLNALKMLIVPLIASSIITGIASTGGGKDFGRLGGKTLLYYMSTSLIAILIGLTLVNAIGPGYDESGNPAYEKLALTELDDATKANISDKGWGDIAEIFIRMVPPNIVKAAAEGQMLGLIFFSLLFGFFITRLKGDLHDTMLNFWKACFQVMMLVTTFIIQFAPIGVFALLAKTVSTTGFDAFKNLFVFFITVILALAIHFVVVLPSILYFIAKVNPLRHYSAMAPALLTAFSTASSGATLPLTLECVEHRAGVSNRVTSFVLPLGATVNMDGTALFECVAAMFIAQAYGIELSPVTQFTIVFIALMTSIGVAAIPKASLVAIMVILTSLGLPVEALGLILAVDRILDMCRTSINVLSDSVGAVVIAKTEGETGVLSNGLTTTRTGGS